MKKPRKLREDPTQQTLFGNELILGKPTQPWDIPPSKPARPTEGRPNVAKKSVSSKPTTNGSTDRVRKYRKRNRSAQNRRFELNVSDLTVALLRNLARSDGGNSAGGYAARILTEFAIRKSQVGGDASSEVRNV